MDFDMPGPDDPRRQTVRDWVAENPNPTGREMAEAGYVVPHWPAPFGLEADPMTQLLIDDELRQAGIKGPQNAIGIGWAAPTIFMAGTQEQKDRYLLPCFAGEEIWCQLFSEPDSGSDLASLSTRAVRDGDEYIVNGSKIWSSGAHLSNFGILIARTDPDVAKHKGISYFICPMDLPGITMTPIIDMTTAHSFNQVFFDDVRIPASMLVGDEGDGWRLAKVTLSNERVSLSSGGALWGSGPDTGVLFDLVKQNGPVTDPVLRQQLAQVFTNGKLLEFLQARSLSARLQGRTPGPEASIQKLFADEHGQAIMVAARALSGTHGMLSGAGPAGAVPGLSRAGATEVNFGQTDEFPGVDPIWHYGYLFQPALTVGGGTFAIQRNIVAEHVLGLPREPNVEAGKSWAETRGKV
ncbi:MAG: acyl-CoA dehydrogenase [Actinomycetia bacterium]|nr:acyl-CoA dehydrogenase [Actinomycetes bacterium]MCP4961459.1 acyl-CoA dehydrogenase [Actinomycetes bacterium]